MRNDKESGSENLKIGCDRFENLSSQGIQGGRIKPTERWQINEAMREEEAWQSASKLETNGFRQTRHERERCQIKNYSKISENPTPYDL